MSLSVTLKPDQQQLDEMRELLGGIVNGTNRAMSGAINKVLPATRKGFVEDVAGHVFLKPADIRKCIDIQRASPSNPAGLIQIVRKPVKASYFPFVPGAVGVRVMFGPDRPAPTIQHTFAAKMPSGHIGIFKRGKIGRHVVSYSTLASAGAFAKGVKSGKRLKAFGKYHSSWLPIDELQGPTVEGVVQDAPNILARRIQKADALLTDKLNDQVNRLLERKKPDETE